MPECLSVLVGRGFIDDSQLNVTTFRQELTETVKFEALSCVSPDTDTIKIDDIEICFVTKRSETSIWIAVEDFKRSLTEEILEDGIGPNAL